MVVNLLFFFFFYPLNALPNRGTCNDVTGMASLTFCWKTVKERRTVTPASVLHNQKFKKKENNFSLELHSKF